MNIVSQHFFSFIKSCFKGPGTARQFSFLLAAFLFFSTFSICYAAHAEGPDEKGVLAAVNTLKYVRGLNTSASDLTFGVVFDPENSASKSEADAVQAILSGAAGARKVTLVPVNDLAKAEKVDVFYLVDQLSNHYEDIQSYALKNKVFNISLDEGCVRNDCCLIAIKQRGSNVDVLMNNQALRSAGFDVDAILKYMAVII